MQTPLPIYNSQNSAATFATFRVVAFLEFVYICFNLCKGFGVIGAGGGTSVQIQTSGFNPGRGSGVLELRN